MGRPPYEAAVRLSEAAIGNWQGVDGHYSGQGVDILRLPLSRFLSVIYVWCMERVEDAEKWDARLNDPLPGPTHRRRRNMSARDELAQLAQFNIEVPTK